MVWPLGVIRRYSRCDRQTLGLTQPSRFRNATLLTLTDMRRVQWLVRGTVEARNAALAVDTRGVVLGIQTQSSVVQACPYFGHKGHLHWVSLCLAHLAIQADTSTLVHVVQVLAGVEPVHLGVIVTVIGMAMAVAGCGGRANG